MDNFSVFLNNAYKVMADANSPIVQGNVGNLDGKTVVVPDNVKAYDHPRFNRESEFAMQHMQAMQEGYGKQESIVYLNAASRKVASLLGTPDIVVETKVGSLKEAGKGIDNDMSFPTFRLGMTNFRAEGGFLSCGELHCPVRHVTWTNQMCTQDVEKKQQ